MTRAGMRRAGVAGAAVLLLLAAALWWAWSRQAVPVAWQGYVDADFVRIGPTQAGLLTGLRVARGDRVRVGQPLFDQDDVAEHAARDQAVRQAEEGARQLANLQGPARDTEIRQAASNLADAEATRDRARADLRRLEAAAPAGAATLQARDAARAAWRSAEARVAGLRAALDQAQAPTGRMEQIRAQAATAGAARAALAIMDWRLAQRHVVAPDAGVIADILAWPGEVLDAGTPVISLLPPDHIVIRLFVPEGMLARIHPGDRVGLACDGCPPGLEGQVDFIAPRAEYTPPLIFSDQSRAKLVYLVQARPRADQAGMLNPGQPVTVSPAWAPAR
ncbi:HlyD family secretion protein [Gluconacetobacter diazotrophicus]|uniref:HlyD family secretion protein n=1 Tax=Gluconacetobacter diazotrophicus TaxID=33996 RepID=UPI0002F21B0F|nr:HlyD family efflux transporter periplasmic adaptor subunit [Gluconacetobacter diazotrophicus]